MKALTLVSHPVGDINHPSPLVIQRDEGGFAAKDLADLVAYQVDDGLEIELAGQALLDAVDNGQFGRALLALLQKAMGLVEEAGVLQGDAHAGREGAQQTNVTLVVAVHRPVLHGNDAGDLVANEYRHTQPRLLFLAGNLDRTQIDRLLEGA